MGKRYLACLGIVPASLALVACGSSNTSTTASTKTVPKAEVIAKGDAICTKNMATVTATPPNVNPATATSAQLKAFAPFLQQNAASIKADVSQVGALGKPDSGAAQLAAILAKGRITAADLQAAAIAAGAGNVAAFKAAFARQSSTSARQAAKQFGFKVCAQGGK